MSTQVKKPENSGSDFDPISAGMHHAVCYSVIDLGVQKRETMYGVKWQQRIFFTFEIPSERIEYEKDGEKKEGPRVIGKEYTASLHEKAILRQDLESWRGRKFKDEELNGFQLSNLIGINALLNVQHNVKGEKTYANIAAINPLMKGTEIAQPENTPIHYEIEMGEKFPENMPEWIINKIKNSEQFTQEVKDEDQQHIAQADSHVEQEEDDLPF